MAKSLDKTYYVYILTNGVRTLYVGVTNDVFRRIHEHRQKLIPGFTRKYNLTWLAYYEETSDVASAIAREKQIKSWRRSKKVDLIESVNPRWKDLALEWFEGDQ
ncbi:MAG: GIY-YIG nuclease family protein [Chloroflexi bacterium]|nr:GIY-YIG nuclease family protein [Chloroflexota bacterium]